MKVLEARGRELFSLDRPRRRKLLQRGLRGISMVEGRSVRFFIWMGGSEEGERRCEGREEARSGTKGGG